MSKITEQEAIAALFTEAEQAVETDLKELAKKELPIVINRLQNAEKLHPGFLGICKIVDNFLIDVCDVALTWANS